MSERSQPMRALQAEIGEAPLPAAERLAADELTALTALIRTARRRQQTLLAGALEGALSHVPIVLRGAVRRILLPE